MSARRGAPTRRFDGYVFDLDGTVYLDGNVIDGAAETIAVLRQRGARITFVTNKPLDGPAHYAALLAGGGIAATADDVVTSVDALTSYLAGNHRGATVMVVGEPYVENALRRAGHTITTRPKDAAVVVVSFDRTFDYDKLVRAYQAVRAGAAIVATNPDPYCPTAEGGLPDCAAMLAAVEACTGVRAEAVVGKPSRHMADAFLPRLGVPPHRAVLVGDRLATDVAMGHAAGMSTVLVVGAEASPAPSGLVPDAVISSLLELLDLP